VAKLLASSSYSLRALHRDAEAGQRIGQAFRILLKTGDYPVDKIELASEADIALRALADQYAATHQPAKAQETYRELLSKVKATNPNPQEDLRNAVYISAAYDALARILRADGRAPEAGSLQAERRSIWSRWNQKLPNNAFVQGQLASARAE
jgi:hypothetical protein